MSSGPHHYVLCCAGVAPMSQRYLEEVKDIFRRHRISVTQIDDRSRDRFSSLEVCASTERPVDTGLLKLDLMKLADDHKIDAAFIEDTLFRSKKKLIVFDMDSTLIQGEVINEMANLHGIGAAVGAITKRAMEGELSFDESLRQRIALLKGFPKSKMEQIHHRLKLSPGADRLVRTVKQQGYKTAIVSGGFRFFADALGEELGIDYVYANDLDWDGDVLSGKVNGAIVNAEKKAELLDVLCAGEKIDLAQVVAVGDGANDLLMLAKAGMGIAYHAKDKVKRESRHHLSHGPMTVILYFLGIAGDHFE